ncbi:MAG: Nramp family divalent metal transporter [Candidatus Omnitrophica bacterium]|nr:Nramp family divalent metal transporter [Candidatus Omnitrophota bacterium]MBU0880575.1 Nramp family divalent metal transporter [Candidatus Omnitrophota bacterium]MBU1808488.1 Nramp family divalent metal transporter [Candidatus Omnitrophota bacterium]
MNSSDAVKKPSSWKSLLIFLSVMGPGIITANVDNDAGGIATYSVAGAHFGYSLLWIFIPMTVALIVIQEMCSRMGVVTGKGLADLIREKFGVKVTFYAMLVLIFSNLTNTISEFSGIAASCEIFGISKYVSVPMAAIFVWWVVVKGTYKSVEKVFLGACLFYLAYVITGFRVEPSWGEVLKETITPSFHFNKAFILMVMGVVGTTIAPWMQFYQQSSVVEKGISVKDYKYARLDVIIGGVLVSIIAMFIMISCAATLFKSGIRIESAKDAALALEPLAGRYCSKLFAFGLLNASVFAAMILPLATAYSVCEGLGWENGVDKRFKDAPQFYFLFTALIIIGAGFIMFPNINLIMVMLLSQAANSVFLPFVLVFMLLLINDKRLMGEHRNSRFFNIVSWATVVVTVSLTLGLTITMFLG